MFQRADLYRDCLQYAVADLFISLSLSSMEDVEIADFSRFDSANWIGEKLGILPATIVADKDSRF